MADSNLEQINKVFSELAKKIIPDKALMTTIAGHMHASVMANIQNQGRDVPGGWPSAKMFPGKQLINQGNLLRSIQANASESTSEVFTNRKGAALMNFGGVVKAKKVLGSVKRHRDVWAMEQYFWSQWYKSGKKEKNWMILALHMQRHDSITVQARPFMVLTEPYMNKIVDAIRQHIAG